MIKEEKKEDGKTVKLKEKVTVYATGKGDGKYLPKGKELKIHPLLAEKLIKAGKATEKPPKSANE